MRTIAFLVLFLAACASTSKGTSGTRLPAAAADSKVRVVWNQYRGVNTIFVIENVAGRDLVELRSRKLGPNERPVAYVPDDVMQRMLKELKRLDWEKHAIPRPENPLRLGAKGEITIIDPLGRRTSFLRLAVRAGDAEQLAAAQAFGRCSETFHAVWRAFPPQMQATASAEGFGVKRAGDGRR